LASYDRLVAEPKRFGAWWGVAVGQYSQRAPFEAGIAKLRPNPAVVAAAGYDDQTDIAKIGGRNTRFLASSNYIGHEGPVMAAGRAPAAKDEIALGGDTLRTLTKNIGDEVTVVANSTRPFRMRVVGIVLINDPITSQSGAGDG